MNRLPGLVAALVLMIGCTAQPERSPAPTSSSAPTSSPAATASLPTTSLAPTATAGVTPTATVAATEPPPSHGCGPTLSLTPLASGFDDLTFVTNAGDGSGDLYVVEQVGRVHRLPTCQSAPPQAPWLDISDRISAGGERGLLGLAFHPDFVSNGRFFVDYTNRDGNSVVSEFTRSADGTVDPGAERVLLQVDQPFANHNGGMLAFGPDGYLYIGFGDGGSGGDPMGNGQNRATLLGKILRIDVDSRDPYGIPADNPFQPGNGEGRAPEIWDWGLRNPWRFSFDRETGALWIGDVGQSAVEEIDFEPAGEGGRNYGWNVMEAEGCYRADACDQTGMTLPVATYSHDEGCSVTGGYVYRGQEYPSLFGLYFYADYCSGTIWTLDADALGAGQPVAPTVFGTVDFTVSSFGEDEAGELYIVDHSGTVYSLGIS
jgi:glucose/arabinose dehydrogenase